MKHPEVEVEATELLVDEAEERAERLRRRWVIQTTELERSPDQGIVRQDAIELGRARGFDEVEERAGHQRERTSGCAQRVRFRWRRPGAQDGIDEDQRGGLLVLRHLGQDGAREPDRLVLEEATVDELAPPGLLRHARTEGLTERHISLAELDRLRREREGKPRGREQGGDHCIERMRIGPVDREQHVAAADLSRSRVLDGGFFARAMSAQANEHVLGEPRDHRAEIADRHRARLGTRDGEAELDVAPLVEASGEATAQLRDDVVEARARERRHGRYLLAHEQPVQPDRDPDLVEQRVRGPCRRRRARLHRTDECIDAAGRGAREHARQGIGRA